MKMWKDYSMGDRIPTAQQVKKPARKYQKVKSGNKFVDSTNNVKDTMKELGLKVSK